MSTMKDAYVRFLNFVNALKELPELPSLDQEEQAILNIVLLANVKRERLLVVELSLMVPETSQSTVLRRIKNLQSKGMLMIKKDNQDKRIRTIHLTPLAEKYFDKMGRIIKASA